jgi:two-component system LytT family response regulator
MHTLKTIRVLVIDDERLTLQGLTQELYQLGLPPNNLSASTDPTNAEHLITAFNPDLLLLNVQLTGMTGFEFLKQIPRQNFRVAFIANDARYALDAIKVAALDYLVTPIKTADLSATMTRLLSSLKPVERTPDPVRPSPVDIIPPLSQKKIALPTMEDITIFPLEDISYFESNDNLSYLHLTCKKKIAVNLRLINLENRLSGLSFYRIHKRFLVNTAKVKRITRKNGNLVVLENGTCIALSRYRRKAFLALLYSSI